MKTLLILLVMIPKLVAAQLSIDGSTCVHVQAIRPLKKNGKADHYQKPDSIEKFIEKRKKKTRNS
jgi:hypothetical protein